MTTNPISGPTAPYFSVPEEPTYRRRLQGELLQMEDLFFRTAPTDSTSRKVIDLWYGGFKQDRATLRELFRGNPFEFERQEKALVIRYMELLHSFLVDRIRGVSLDVDARLGSDGESYNAQALTLWLSWDKPAIYQTRSPLHPDDPRTFIIEPHPVVPHMIRWLKSYTPPDYVDAGLEALQREYDELRRRGPLPRLPTRRNVEMREAFAAAAEARRAATERHAQEEAKQAEDLGAEEEAAKQRADEEFAAEAERLAAEEAALQADIAAAAAEDARAKAEFDERMGSAQANLGRNEAEVKGCKSDLSYIGEQLGQVRASNDRLGSVYAEVRNILDKQDRDDIKGALKAVVIMGACMAARQMLAPYLPPTVQAGPIPGGGAFKLTVPFTLGS